MATFKKGQSMKNQRVHISSEFDQKGPKMNGKNIAFSISNDTKEKGDVMTDPMLVYDTYKDAKGETQNTFTASYSSKQWEAIEKAANKEGDSLVVNADLFPNKNGKGLVVNTNKLSTPEVAFDKEAHQTNTLEARSEKKAAREAAAAEKESAKEAPEQKQEQELEQ